MAGNFAGIPEASERTPTVRMLLRAWEVEGCGAAVRGAPPFRTDNLLVVASELGINGR